MIAMFTLCVIIQRVHTTVLASLHIMEMEGFAKVKYIYIFLQ